MMPVPETAKWEEQMLASNIKTINALLDCSILLANSLGKVGLQDRLEKIKKYTAEILS